MARKLALLFDGTWNNEGSNTNVVRMRDAIVSSGADDPKQPLFYDTGVGTSWHTRFTGAAFGRGLSHNIRQGYGWLANRYQPGDAIYVFGFSRGAYTARSLVGLIRKCGILHSDDEAQVAEAYELYRDKDVAPDDEKAAGFRASRSREARVRFIGVWDTVGALGIPVSHVPFSRDYYRWHDTELSKIVDYACHAIAVDENRKDYDVAVWTAIRPENIKVEQRWFVGAHANVGGGYPDDPLHTRPLRWMQDGAEAAGLIGGEDVRRVAIGVREDGDRLDLHLAQRPHDSDGDLATVRDQDFREHRWHLPVRSRHGGSRGFSERRSRRPLMQKFSRWQTVLRKCA